MEAGRTRKMAQGLTGHTAFIEVPGLVSSIHIATVFPGIEHPFLASTGTHIVHIDACRHLFKINLKNLIEISIWNLGFISCVESICRSCINVISVLNICQKHKSNLTVLQQRCKLMLSCAFPGNLEASF